ncbi:MAG: ROK family protein [Anaerolineae bacterium]
MTTTLALDFGGTRTRAGWFDDEMRLVRRDEMLSKVQEPQQEVIARIIALARHAADGQQPDCIGIAAPGPLDAERGVIEHAETLPGWREVPLRDQISAAFDGAPAFMQNDANLAAVAESAIGAGQGANPVIYLTISTGIGGGAVIDGKLFTGWRGLAIEPGHMLFTLPDGRVKKLEEIASGTAIGARARALLAAEDTPSVLRDIAVVDGKAVGEAALAGDAFALRLIAETGRWLGLGFVNLLHLFNPQAIVVGGSVSGLGDLLFDPAREVMKRHVLSPHFDDAGLIRPAALGDDVCLYGAAHYARHQMMAS